MKRILFAVLMILLVLPCSFATNRSEIGSREFKIILKAEHFNTAKKGCEQFWQVVEKVAAEHNIKTNGKTKLSPLREICFLDTAKFDFYEKGFILRLRVDNFETNGGSDVVNDGELTLKFRAPDSESVLLAPVTPSSEYDNDLSCEEDVVMKLGKPASMFSRSGKIYGYTRVPDIYMDVNKYFPESPLVGLAGKAKIKKVNDLVILERRIQLGSLYFAEKKTKTIFSIWYKKGEEKPFVAEFSFKIKLTGKNSGKMIRSNDQVEKFFIDLAKEGKALIAPKQTKTGMVYQMR